MQFTTMRNMYGMSPSCFKVVSLDFSGLLNFGLQVVGTIMMKF